MPTTTEPTQIPLSEFIAEQGITIESIRVDEKPGFVPHTEPFGRRPIGMRPTPSKDDDGWEHYAWSVTLNRDAPVRSLSTPWRAGTAHVERSGKRTYYGEWGETLRDYKPTPPTVEDVLDSLASEASTYHNGTNFEDFCAEFGYDTDSRKAERIYNTLAEQTKALRHFLGQTAFDQLLDGVERL